MGKLITEVYNRNIVVPTFTNDLERNAYSKEWREVFAHPDVGLLRPEAVEGLDVLIALDPIYVPASSAYAVVAYFMWSKFNGDFTQESRKMFTGETDDEIIAKIKAFQHNARPIIALHITQTYFPSLWGVEYGVNLWPIQLNSTFVAA